MREFSTKFSLSHTSLSKLVNLVIYAHFFHSHLIVSFVTLNRPSNSSRLKITNRSFYHSAPALWNTLPPDLRQLSHHHPLSQPICNSPVSALSCSLFLKKAQDSSFSFFISSIVCTHLGFLWTDISGIDLARLLHLILISSSFILISFMPIFCYLNCKCLRIS